MMHKVKIEPIRENDLRTRVSIDDRNVRCTGYVMSQCVGEVPEISLEVCAIPDVEQAAIVHVANKEEIARIMDYEEFSEFCEIWKEIHEEI